MVNFGARLNAFFNTKQKSFITHMQMLACIVQERFVYFIIIEYVHKYNGLILNESSISITIKKGDEFKKKNQKYFCVPTN